MKWESRSVCDFKDAKGGSGDSKLRDMAGLYDSTRYDMIIVKANEINR